MSLPPPSTDGADSRRLEKQTSRARRVHEPGARDPGTRPFLEPASGGRAGISQGTQGSEAGGRDFNECLQTASRAVTPEDTSHLSASQAGHFTLRAFKKRAGPPLGGKRGSSNGKKLQIQPFQQIINSCIVLLHVHEGKIQKKKKRQQNSSGPFLSLPQTLNVNSQPRLKIAEFLFNDCNY